MMNVSTSQTVMLHGHSINYVQKGAGPVFLLIHGMAGSLETWRSVIAPLARHATVLAVDLPGHGTSSPGGGDYSLGSLAAGLRDVLTALGHDRVTLVGHSLGGGIAMQFSYQFPEMTERLVLVSSGGLGLEVSPALRAAALPGANLFLSVTAEATRRASGIARRVLRATRSPAHPDLDELVRSYASLADADRRSAFLATVRSVVGLGGQTVRAEDRLYLAKDLPVLLIWGAEDPIIPVEHARAAHDLLPHSTLEVFEGVRHFPHVEAPQRFVTTLEDFCAATEPAVFDAATWRARMRVTDTSD
jgi:pimeloyl-ACP methyl ester carboxylesterase